MKITKKKIVLGGIYLIGAGVIASHFYKYGLSPAPVENQINRTLFTGQWDVMAGVGIIIIGLFVNFAWDEK